MTSTSLADSYDTYPAVVARPRAHISLRHRLPLLIFALLGCLGGAFSWMAYHEVVRALKMNGAERLLAAGNQVADLLGQAGAARLTEATRLAADPAVRQTIDGPTDGVPIPAAVEAFVSRNPLATVWLYDGSGRLLRALARGKQTQTGTDAAMPATVPAAGIGPLRAQDSRVSYDTTVPISADAHAAPAGFLSIQRGLGTTQAMGLIERLIGSGVALKIGNASGDVWTDLNTLVPPPPGAAIGATTEYTTSEGGRRMGAAVAVAHSPWLVWVEMPETTILGPATMLLRRMLPIILVFTAFGALAVYGVSSRITKPLEQVAQAADAIAAGDFTRRVDVRRQDEIGRMGTAFNVMAARVGESHEALEQRVTERTRESELAREELDRFFSLSLDLLCIAGTDGRFRRVNPAWEQVLGWSAADLTAIPYLDLVHPDDRAATIREASNLADGGSTMNFENRYRTKDGGYRWLSWKSASLPSRGVVYAAAHDVTQQRETERALHQHGAALASANKELEAFSYSVSHDLRSPLRSIDGFAQALVEDYDARLDDTGRDYLARIRAAAQRMGLLIDDLLSLSRVTRVELSRAPVDLTALATDAAARLGEQDKTRQVEWRIQPGLIADGDSRLLRIVLDNLLGNAWKFTSKRANATIEFGTEPSSNGHRVFRVRDNGAGFDMAHATKLFGAFQRLHGVSEFAGTGIGLATVQRIIHRHGGRVWAEASVGAGATFFFTLEAS